MFVLRSLSMIHKNPQATKKKLKQQQQPSSTEPRINLWKFSKFII